MVEANEDPVTGIALQPDAPPTTVDVVVIGAGSAGMNAFRAIDRAGKSVLLVDGGPLGTMCARVGCMPSKGVLQAGERWAAARSLVPGEPGEALEPPIALWRRARALRDSMVDGVVQATRRTAGDRLVEGYARFVDATTIEVDGRRIVARAFVVAIGSRPVVPEALRALGDRVLTTDTLFEIDALPASIGVLGLGAVGLEMSLALARLGVKVLACDSTTSIGGLVDPAVVARVVERLGDEIEIWRGEEVEPVAVDGGVELRSSHGTRRVDRVLAALGRKSPIDALDLAAAGVGIDADGKIDVDLATTRCGTTRVFLAGDASPDRPLQHEAVDEGGIAAASALAVIDGHEPAAGKRRTPLSIVFTDPDIGQVGKRLDQLDRDAIVIGEAEGSGNGRSHIMGADGNLIRLYVDRVSGRLEGAVVFAVRGEHLAHLLAWAVAGESTVDRLLEMPFYHPTLEELVQNALADAAQKRRHAVDR